MKPPILVGFGYDFIPAGHGLGFTIGRGWDNKESFDSYMTGLYFTLADLRERLGVERLTDPETGDPLDPSYADLVRDELFAVRGYKLEAQAPVAGVLKRFYMASDDLFSIQVLGVQIDGAWVIGPFIGSEQRVQGLPAQPFGVSSIGLPGFPKAQPPDGLYPDVDLPVKAGAQIRVYVGNADMGMGHTVSIGAWIDPAD